MGIHGVTGIAFTPINLPNAVLNHSDNPSTTHKQRPLCVSLEDSTAVRIHIVVLCSLVGTNVSRNMLNSSSGLGQYVPPNHFYPFAVIYSDITQKATV